MRHTLLALLLASAALAFSAPGQADASNAYAQQGYYGHYQQTCITKRMRTEDRAGKTVTKRVRICQ